MRLRRATAAARIATNAAYARLAGAGMSSWSMIHRNGWKPRRNATLTAATAHSSATNVSRPAIVLGTQDHAPDRVTGLATVDRFSITGAAEDMPLRIPQPRQRIHQPQ